MNRVPIPKLNNQIPYTLLYKTDPDINQLKVFGSIAFASTLQGHRTKLDLRARKCVFLGYKPGVKGVILYDLLDKNIFLSRHVTHHESIFPYKSDSPKIPWDYYHSTTNPCAPSCPTTFDSDISPTPHAAAPTTNLLPHAADPTLSAPSPSPNSTYDSTLPLAADQISSISTPTPT
jgi:hypothetical protein